MELIRRKDFIDVEDAASSHPRRHLYYRRVRSVEDEIDDLTLSINHFQQQQLSQLRSGGNRSKESEHNTFLRLFLQRGDALFQQETYHGAIDDYSAFLAGSISAANVLSAVQRDEDTTHAVYTRGVCYERIGMLDEAIEDFTLTLEMDPQHKAAAYERAACQNKKCNFTAAILDYERALSMDPAELSLPNATGIKRVAPRVCRSKFASQRCGLTRGTVTGGSQHHLPKEAPHVARKAVDSATSSDTSDSFQMDDFGTEPRRIPSTPKRSAAHLGNTPAGATPLHGEALADLDASTFVDRTPGYGSVSASPTDEAEYHHQLGFACRRQGDLQGAIKEYTEALQIDPTHFKALFNRGFCYDKIGQYDAAIADYTAALQIEPDNAYTYYNIGIAYDRRGDSLPQAIEMFTHAIRLDSTNSDFFHNRGFSQRKMGRYREAVNDYTKAIELEPQHFKAYYNRAFCFDKLSNYERAVEDYTEAIRIDSRNPNAFHNRGISNEKLGRLHDALHDFTKAVELDPSNAATFNSRGMMYDRLEEYDKAVSDYTSAIALQQNNAVFYHNRGFTYRNKNDFQAAIRDYSIALSLNPRSVAAYNNRGFAERKLGLYDLAVQDYTKSLELNPGSIKTLNNRGYSYARLGDYDAAIADYDHVLRVDPTNIHALHNRGISYEKIQKLELAIDDFTQVMRLDPENANALYNRGCANDTLGNYAQALKDYNLSFEMDLKKLGPNLSPQELEEFQSHHPAALAAKKIQENRRK